MDFPKFLEDLKGPDAYTELKAFNLYWDSQDDALPVLQSLLQVTPNCEMLFSVFEKTKDNIKPRDVNIFLTTLGNIIISIASQAPELVAVSQAIVQQLLQKHSALISRALSTRNESSVLVPALRVLMAGVLAGEDSAAVIIRHFDWTLMSHCVEKRDKSDVKDSDKDARTYCFGFYMALLDLHKNKSLFEQFLETGALSLLYKGLMLDAAELVVPLLDKLRINVLQNDNVGKSLKVKTFNGSTTAPLVALQNWTKVRENNESSSALQTSPITIEGRKIISVALCQFLSSLCSSYKHGIAFAANEQSEPCNGYVLKIIKCISVYMLVDENYRNVVSSSLRACPDIIKEYSKHINNNLELSSNRFFQSVLQMYSDLIGGINPFTFSYKTIPRMVQLLLPEPINGKFMKSVFYYSHNQFDLKVNCLKVIHSVTSTGDKTMKALGNTEPVKCSELNKTIRNFLQESITNVESIMDVWNHMMSQGDDDDDILDKLLIVLQALIQYTQYLPSPDLQRIVMPELMLESILSKLSKRSDDNLQLIIACLQLTNSLQCKFDVLSQAKDEILQQDLLEKFKLVFSIYMNVFKTEKDIVKKNKILALLLEHIDSTLVNYGFSPHTEANISPWLNALVEAEESCIEFLCFSIVSTIASLERFYDKVVVITRNNATEQLFDPSILSARFRTESCIEDSTDITTANIPLCFSRLVLGNLEVLARNQDEAVMNYFSEVVKLYIQGLADPQVLAQYLLNDYNMELPLTVTHYCRCWLGQKSDKINLTRGDTFASNLEFLFMSKNFSLSDTIIEEVSMPDNLDARTCLLKACLLYLHVDTMDTASEDTKVVVQSYIKLIKHIMQSILDDFEEEISKLSIYTIILEHPAIFNKYQLFQEDERYTFACKLISELISEENRSDKAIVLTYFKESSTKLQKHLKNDVPKDDIDYLQLFAPFMARHSCLTDGRFELFKIILVTHSKFLKCESFLKLACSVAESVILLDKIENKRKLYLALYSHLSGHSYLLSQKEPSNSLLSFFELVEQGILRTMQKDDVRLLMHDDLKWLLSLCRSLGSCLLRQILIFHPQYVSYVSKRVRKTEFMLPKQGALLHFFIEDPTTDPEFVSFILTGVKSDVVDWLKNYDAEDVPGYRGIVQVLLERGILGGGDASSAVKIVYSRLVQQDDETPPSHLASICAACESLKGHKKESRLPLPDALLSSLHMLLCCAERLCDGSQLSSAARQKQLDCIAPCIQQLLPKLHRRTRTDKADNLIWRKFAKKVIDNCMIKPCSTSVALFVCLREVLEWQYDSWTTAGDKGMDYLSPRELHKQLVMHPHYETLMLHSYQDTHDSLKENVLRVQSSLLRLCPAVSKDCHASRLLSAYTATTKTSDQTLLQVLRQYELVGALEDMLPIVWGEAATTYYTGSVFTEPRPEQILALIDANMLFNTCINFDKTMNADPNMLCRVPASDSRVYDLRFMLPVLLYVASKCSSGGSAPSERVLGQLLSVAVGVLTAQDVVIRTHAIKIVRVLRESLSNVKVNCLRTFWTWLIDIICYSLHASAASAAKGVGKLNKKFHKNSDKATVSKTDEVAETNNASASLSFQNVAPLSGPVARFFIEVILCVERADHPLFTVLMNFTFLFPSIRPNQVPEMLRLYHSPCAFSSSHSRLLLLRMASQGVRTSADFQLIQRNAMPTLIMAMLLSPTVTLPMQLEALEALCTMVVLPNGCFRLFLHLELLQMLPSSVQRWSDTESQSSVVNVVIRLIGDAWTTIEQAAVTGQQLQAGQQLDSDEFAPQEAAAANGGIDESNNQQQEDFMEEGEGGPYDEGYYDEDYDMYADDAEYSDEEEKSKVRKKRKLEAKNRKAAKKAKLEEQETNAKTEAKLILKQSRVETVDSILICDIVQCLFTLASIVFKSQIKETIERYEDVVKNITSYVQNNVNIDNKVGGPYLKVSLDSLQQRIKTLAV